MALLASSQVLLPQAMLSIRLHPALPPFVLTRSCWRKAAQWWRRLAPPIELATFLARRVPPALWCGRQPEGV